MDDGLTSSQRPCILPLDDTLLYKNLGRIYLGIWLLPAYWFVELSNSHPLHTHLKHKTYKVPGFGTLQRNKSLLISHYLNQGWDIDNWISSSKPKWHFNRHSYILFHLKIYGKWLPFSLNVLIYQTWVGRNLAVSGVFCDPGVSMRTFFTRNRYLRHG